MVTLAAADAAEVGCCRPVVMVHVGEMGALVECWCFGALNGTEGLWEKGLRLSSGGIMEGGWRGRGDGVGVGGSAKMLLLMLRRRQHASHTRVHQQHMKTRV